MLKLALIGDLHLSERSPRFTHVLDTLDAAIADAVGQGVTGFCFLGDLVEGRPSPRDVWALAVRFRSIAEHGGWVAVIQGNHEDAETGMIWEALGVRCSAWNDFQAIHDEATILCLPYPRRGRAPFDMLDNDGTIKGSMTAAAERIAARIAEECAATAHVDGQRGATVPTPVIVLGHFTMAGMMTRDTRFEQHTATEVIVPIEALRGAAFAGVGHIHREGWYCVACAAWVAGWLPACTCGALASTATLRGVGGLIRHSFGEVDDEKSYTLLTVVPAGVTWERRAIPCRAMFVDTLDWPLTAGTRASLTDPRALDWLRGQEVKLTVRISEDQLGTFDPHVFEAVKDVASYFVLDRVTVPMQRTRAPEIFAADTPTLQLSRWFEAIGDAPQDAAHWARLTAKLAEVTA